MIRWCAGLVRQRFDVDVFEGQRGAMVLESNRTALVFVPRHRERIHGFFPVEENGHESFLDPDLVVVPFPGGFGGALQRGKVGVESA